MLVEKENALQWVTVNTRKLLWALFLSLLHTVPFILSLRYA